MTDEQAAEIARRFLEDARGAVIRGEFCASSRTSDVANAAEIIPALLAERKALKELLGKARNELANSIETESDHEPEYSVYARELVAEIDAALTNAEGK